MTCRAFFDMRFSNVAGSKLLRTLLAPNLMLSLD